MNIAIDFDDTYTADTDLWDLFVRQARARNHNVYCVTWRSEQQPIYGDSPWTDVIYCDLKAKREVCYSRNIYIDVWCDDNPHAIFKDYPR